MDARRLFDTPDLFLLAFEPQSAVLAQMDRDAYHRSIFCDGRISPKAPPARTPLAPLLEQFATRPAKTPDVGHIFHVAHCGSTLLARALDVKADNLVIREPMALRQLGVQRSASFGGAAPDEWRKRMQLAASMLDRRYQTNGPVIVKGNVPVNFMADDLMALNSKQRAIVLYFSFDHYLQAILRSPNHRKWVETINVELGNGIAALCGPAENQTSAILAARLWLAQIQIYNDLLARHPNVASLNAEDLFNTPRDAVAASAKFFGQEMSAGALDAVMAGELFARYSKNPQVAFDNAARLERRRALAESLAPEIEQARAWIQASGRPLPNRLAKPLVGESPALLG